MKTNFSLKTLAASACLAALALGASGAAQAHGDNIYWSIGMSSPGVQVGVASAPPMVMYPPTYPAYPIYVAPRPVVYMPPAPVYYGPPPGWRHHGHPRWGRGYEGRGDERWEHEREGRWEGRRH